MFDSDDPEVLKDPMFNENRVCTYADLLTPELVAFFGPRLGVIDRGHGDPLNRAHIVDVESGALTVEQGAETMKKWLSEGRQYVTGYVNRSNRTSLAELMPTSGWTLWVATLDGTMDVNDGYTGMVQFAPETVIGKHVDVSVVFHEWWLPVGRLISTAAAQSIVSEVQGLSSTVATLSRAIGVL